MIVWEDSSPKWPIMCRVGRQTLRQTQLTPFLVYSPAVILGKVCGLQYIGRGSLRCAYKEYRPRDNLGSFKRDRALDPQSNNEWNCGHFHTRHVIDCDHDERLQRTSQLAYVLHCCWDWRWIQQQNISIIIIVLVRSSTSRRLVYITELHGRPQAWGRGSSCPSIEMLYYYYYYY